MWFTLAYAPFLLLCHLIHTSALGLLNNFSSKGGDGEGQTKELCFGVDFKDETPNSAPIGDSKLERMRSPALWARE